MTKHDEAKAQIEATLDSVGWLSFLIALSDVCNDKAAHCMENWQDEPLAIAWSTRGDIIDSITKPE